VGSLPEKVRRPGMTPAVKEGIDNLISALSADEYRLEDYGTIAVIDLEHKRVTSRVVPLAATEAIREIVARMTRF
jgi:hypothetical protein